MKPIPHRYKYGTFPAGIAVLLFLSCSLTRSRDTLLTLPVHSGWRLISERFDIPLPAQVPGTVHTDLLAAGKIDSPFFGTNESRQQWIGREDWVYETEITADMSVLTKENILLRFSGLDTYALVTLNDMLLFRADNMFREWTADCRGILKYGKNTLRVRFRSPVKEDSLKASRLGYQLPEQRVFTRKAPYQYGWDWGPRFLTMGIWRPVTLEAWDGPRLEDLQIYQHEVSQKEAVCTAALEISSSDSQTVTVSVSAGDVTVSGTADLVPGRNTVPLDFRLSNPRLWWCRGMGGQHLYRVTAHVRDGKGRSSPLEKKIGIRRLEVIQEPDSLGESFSFRLNGVDFFAKGANYIPQDNFLPRVTPERYESIVHAAAAANMNMLRVWGGGIYEDDYFYQLCDEAGLLIWQDFMFACAMYPGDENFLENVRQEAVQNVKRLRNHACIALWCGNNEVDEAWHNWGWQEQFEYSNEISTKIWSDYQRLFHHILPEVVRTADPGRFYWPSSPSIGWGHEEALHRGDMHYWGVWWGREPFEVYEEKVGRFMSEYGFQGMPGPETISAFTRPADRFSGSAALAAHQKHPFGDENIRLYMSRDYREPKDFSSFLYVSQLLQARGAGIALEAHRRARPYCMGTLYWQLNDCWPAISWSSLDYFHRWKALHYTVRRIFSNLVILPRQSGDMMTVYINSDAAEPVHALLKMELRDFSGRTLSREELDLTIPAAANQAVWEKPLAKLLDGTSRGACFFDMRLIQGGEELAARTWFFVKPAELQLPSAPIRASVSECRQGYEVLLESSRFAADVYLNFRGSDGWFQDNFFHLLPGVPRRTVFHTDSRLKGMADSLEVISLADSY